MRLHRNPNNDHPMLSLDQSNRAVRRAVARNEIKRRQKYSRGSSGNCFEGGGSRRTSGNSRGGVVDEVLGIRRGGGSRRSSGNSRGGGSRRSSVGICRGGGGSRSTRRRSGNSRGVVDEVLLIK